MEKWLNSSPSQGDIHGFESRWGHHTNENTPVYWTKNWYDIRGFSLFLLILLPGTPGTTNNSIKNNTQY